MLRKLLFAALRISGLPFLFRELIQKHRVTILLFHDISQAAAERSFSFLSKKYEIMDLNDFIEASEKKDRSKVPEKALIITFDDGHLRNYEMLPVIRQHDIPITIFVCAGIINTKRHYWFRFKHESISVRELMSRSNAGRLDILAKAGFEQERGFDIPQALQRVHLEEMKPVVNFQSHTLFHPVLPRCDTSEAQREISGSKEMLEEEYGLRINALSYPHGDYSERDIALSRQAGYRCGITVDFGFNTLDTDLFRLKRICMNDSGDMNELLVKASGVWDFFKSWNGRKQRYGLTDVLESKC